MTTAARRDLETRAAAHGVETGFWDVWGRWRDASDEALEGVLSALGPGVEPDRRRKRARTAGTPQPLPERTWGVFTPTRTLWRRDGDVGFGTLRELTEVGEVVGRLGGGVLATLPLAATRVGDASPYAPVTRVMWDESVLDLDALSRELAEGGAVPAPVPVPVEAGRVDPAARRRQVHDVLGALVDAGGREVRKRLAAQTRERPLVAAYARWRAAQAGEPGTVETHLLAQWAVQHQLDALVERLRGAGVGLLLDVPVGTHPEGFDVSRAPERFALAASVGAPPDEFFVEGQNWGFPPPQPDAAADLLVEVVEHHSRHADFLRVDHVMGIHRLWWVPQGLPATEGAYVRYPATEIWPAVRAAAGATTLAGEDLGTVPEDVWEAMAEHGILGLHELQFDAESPDDELPARCIAGTGTHDMPTWSGFWLDRPEAARSLAAHQARRLGRPDPTDAGAALDLALEVLGRSDAAIVLANLEDLVGETVPLNVPGTSEHERPDNWRRRPRLPIEELSTVTDRLRKLDHSRSGPATGPSHTDGLIGEQDLFLFNEGTHRHLHHVLGAHPDGDGCWFAVWAPNARHVAVVGDWNAWDGKVDEMLPVQGSGIWQVWAAGAEVGHRYKFRVVQADGREVDKADPYAVTSEVPPLTGSIVADPQYEWEDADWMSGRGARHGRTAPISIYELHLGSFAAAPDGADRFATYRELGPAIAEHCRNGGFTHVELLPVMEHPFAGSWGYQSTGFFAPTSRFGGPEDFMWFVDHLHQNGIGVILDWVPSHFPTDDFALAGFDGTALYEHADPRQGFHPDWGSLIFNYGRHEVRSFLMSSAVSWLERYHVDGLRVDAVASMLYLDYSRNEGEWIPNVYGGRENLEAIDFLRQLNTVVFEEFPDVTTFAEESTAWPGVSRPTYVGGLGFGFKWDMGWMHDTLQHLSRDPVHRRFHHHELTFRGLYWTSENYTLPLSHDEVVHGKGSLIQKMPGDDWQKAANLRLLLGYQWAVPGKKLLFMGGEFGQWREWNHDGLLDFWLFDQPRHAGIFRWVARCNELYRSRGELHEGDCEPFGFEWVHADDADNGVLAFLRRSESGAPMLVVLHVVPNVSHHYRMGVPQAGRWVELANSDAEEFGGSGVVNGELEAAPVPTHGRDWSVELTLPPLGVTFLAPAGDPA